MTEVSKWVLCFKSCFNSLTSMHIVLLQYAKWEEWKPPIMQFGSISKRRHNRHTKFSCLPRVHFFPPWLEMHWTNSQRVHLHISPISYNHSVCRLWESWNFNERRFHIRARVCLDGMNACGADLVQTVFRHALQVVFNLQVLDGWSLSHMMIWDVRMLSECR